MKKLWLALCFSAFMLQLSASAKCTMTSLLPTLNNTTTVETLLKQYPKNMEETRVLTSNKDKTLISGYILKDIYVGDHPYSFRVFYNLTSHKVNNFFFLVKQEPTGITYEAYRTQLDQDLVKAFGAIDKATYFKSSERQKNCWYKTNCSIISNALLNDKIQKKLYAIVIEFDDQTYNFRANHWGDSREMVAKTEGKISLIDRPKIYNFRDQISGFPCQISYLFDEDKLIFGTYEIIKPSASDTQIIEDYYRLVSYFNKLYGKPDYEISNEDYYAHEVSPEAKLDDIKDGNSTYETDWNTVNTHIAITLSAENTQIKLLVTYESLKFQKEIKAFTF